MKRIDRLAAAAMVAGGLAGPPETTLREDALDAPAATSVREAERARGAAAAGHAMDHGTYRHVDAGRGDVEATSPVGRARRGSAPSPTPDPHAGHAMPAPSPTPDPHAGHVMPSPAPTPDPHAGHVMPSPAPSPETRR